MKKGLVLLAAILLMLAGCSGELPEPDTAELNLTAPLPEKTVIAECSRHWANMKLTLPDKWEYSIVSTEEDDKPFGIEFWLADESQVRLELMYHPEGMAICGTGVTFADVMLPNGTPLTKCTEERQDGATWVMLMLHNLPGEYVLQGDMPTELWTKYQDEVYAILNTAVFGDGAVDKPRAEQLAATLCAERYDYVWSEFDYVSGMWQVKFMNENSSAPIKTVRVSASGAVENDVCAYPLAEDME